MQRFQGLVLGVSLRLRSVDDRHDKRRGRALEVLVPEL
jgi:hypothetical protein